MGDFQGKLTGADASTKSSTAISGALANAGLDAGI